jgi:hypothetical protein
MRVCAWCGAAPVGAGQRYCSKKCRQTAFRLRKRLATAAPVDASRLEPGTFEIADPPYPGMAWMYKDQPSYAGEVDHAALVARLVEAHRTRALCGFGLCTSAKTLKRVLRLFPDDYDYPLLHVTGWFKPVNASEKSKGPTSRWEPLIVVGGRKLRPGFPDWFEQPEPQAIRTAPARQGGESLIGRKPLAYAAFAFDCLGMVAGDSLVDTYPGTGIFSKAWASLSAHASLVAGARQLLLPSLGDREATP